MECRNIGMMGKYKLKDPLFHYSIFPSLHHPVAAGIAITGDLRS